MPTSWPEWKEVVEDKEQEDKKKHFQELMDLADKETAETRRRLREEGQRPPMTMWGRDWDRNNRNSMKQINGLNLESASEGSSRTKPGTGFRGEDNLRKPLPEGQPFTIGSRKSQPIMNKELMKEESGWKQDWVDVPEKEGCHVSDLHRRRSLGRRGTRKRWSCCFSFLRRGGNVDNGGGGWSGWRR